MSLILEALRRSEAERQRGQAPDVLAAVEVMRPARTTGLPPLARWGAAAAGLALVLGVAWWRWTPGPESRPHDAGAAPVDPLATSASATATPAPPTAISAPPPAPRATAVAAPAEATGIPVNPVAVPAPASPNLAETAHPAPPTPAPAAEPALTRAPPTTPVPGPATATAPAPASTEFISPEATVRLAELSSEERQQLPALKISMHMWAPNPADRFVIIDGTRLAEGDRVADATISAIVADGITLAWRGRQIRLPIR